MSSPRSAVVSALLVLLTVAAMLVPGAGAAQEQVTLRVWDQFTGPEGEAVDAVYDAFTTAHPNVTIEREVVTDQQMRQTVNTALASGTGPDVIYYAPGPGYAGVLAEAGLIQPLDDLAKEYG